MGKLNLACETCKSKPLWEDVDRAAIKPLERIQQLDAREVARHVALKEKIDRLAVAPDAAPDDVERAQTFLTAAENRVVDISATVGVIATEYAAMQQRAEAVPCPPDQPACARLLFLAGHMGSVAEAAAGEMERLMNLPPLPDF